MTENASDPRARLDMLGALASFLCIAHCALMPLVGLGFLADERTEWLLLAVSLALDVRSLRPCYRYWHFKPQPLWLLAG